MGHDSDWRGGALALALALACAVTCACAPALVAAGTVEGVRAPSVSAVLSVSMFPSASLEDSSRKKSTAPLQSVVVCVSGASDCNPNPSRSEASEEPKVFFVDEDSPEEEGTNGFKWEKKKSEEKKIRTLPGVPVVVGLAGWKGSVEDDYPIFAPAPVPAPVFPTAQAYASWYYLRRCSCDKATWPCPLPAPSRSAPPLPPHRLPVYPNYRPGVYRTGAYRPVGYRPGGYRHSGVPVYGPRPTPIPGFYGGHQPTVYLRGTGRDTWCLLGARPPSPTPSPAPSSPPVVKDRVDFGDDDEGDGEAGTGTVSINVDGKVDLDSYKR